MIFLFFGTSLALLEAELQHFKDWEEIGDIWDFQKFLWSRPMTLALILQRGLSESSRSRVSLLQEEEHNAKWQKDRNTKKKTRNTNTEIQSRIQKYKRKYKYKNAGMSLHTGKKVFFGNFLKLECQFKFSFFYFFSRFSLLGNISHYIVVPGRRKNRTLFWASSGKVGFSGFDEWWRISEIFIFSSSHC